jgi:hypothetical protein
MSGCSDGRTIVGRDRREPVSQACNDSELAVAAERVQRRLLRHPMQLRKRRPLKPAWSIYLGAVASALLS